MNNSVDIIQKIRQLAKSKGVTLPYLCQCIGKRANFLSDVKLGNASISSNELAIIADKLNTTVEYLTGETDNPANSEPDSQSESDELTEYLTELKTRPEMRMLFSLAKGATKKDVEDAVRIIEALRNRGND